MKLDKLIKKTTKSLHAERDTLLERLERINQIIGALDGRNPKVQRRSKRHRKPMSKATRRKIGIARKKAWAKKGKRGEVAAAA